MITDQCDCRVLVAVLVLLVLFVPAHHLRVVRLRDARFLVFPRPDVELLSRDVDRCNVLARVEGVLTANRVADVVCRGVERRHDRVSNPVDFRHQVVVREVLERKLTIRLVGRRNLLDRSQERRVVADEVVVCEPAVLRFRVSTSFVRTDPRGHVEYHLVGVGLVGCSVVSNSGRTCFRASVSVFWAFSFLYSFSLFEFSSSGSVGTVGTSPSVITP